ncbi:MAG TPA: hypothetical protein VH987_01795 [Candidatus Limnocylindria bacterium]
MAVALFRPPAGKRHVIGKAKAGQALERGGDEGLVCPGALEASGQLPARSRPGGQVAGGDVQGGFGVERRSLGAWLPTPLR